MTLLCRLLSHIALIILLSACSQLTSVPADSIRLSRQLALQLPAPNALGQPFHATQLVTGQYGNQDFNGQFQLELTENKLVLLALAPWGPSLFSATLTPNNLTTSQTSVAQVDVRYMLADFLLTYLPYDALKQSLHGKEITIKESATRREIWLAQTLIIAIDYAPNPNVTAAKSRWQNHIHFHNHLRGYQLEIKTLTFTPAPLAQSIMAEPQPNAEP
ncbi:DUF3261 domain-containing protein [Motilimonas sp. E26]|uniref:DUF3261 domain-containing protein n=1 Tax=Motilimonas sp. E26 TaxID=2865674 RepID=UPI001E5F7090|nr:DUF3261 domain-containing protein [Motilimonas sp. E26]MCE0556470.1 DUF3261 domain-containing protein [Motilimonas sp. E26]